MCVTDLPGDPDGLLVLHDVMEYVDEAYEPSDATTEASSSPLPTFSSDEDDDLPVSPLPTRTPTQEQQQQLAGCTAGGDDANAVVTSAAPPLPIHDALHPNESQLVLDGVGSNEDTMGGMYRSLRAVRAKAKPTQALLAGRTWRVTPAITSVSRQTPATTTSVTRQTPLRPQRAVKPAGKPRQRQSPKDEMQHLRERVRQLEQTLDALRVQALADKEKALETAIVFNLVPQPDLLAPDKCQCRFTDVSGDNQESSKADGSATSASVVFKEAATDVGSKLEASATKEELWERIAKYQKAEWQKSMSQNRRLRALAEQQLRVLKQLELAFRTPRAATRAKLLQRHPHPEKLFRGSLFDSEAAIFQSLRVELESQYRKTDAVFQSTGQARFEGDMARTAVPRSERGARGIFLENTECKVFPFHLAAVDSAVWHCLADASAQYHPGLYEVRELSEDVVAVKISDVVQLPAQDETSVTVWLTVRRIREKTEDGGHRVVCVWNAMVETEGSLCIRLQERGWNVLRPLASSLTSVGSSRAMCVTQTCMRVSPLARVEFAARDLAVGTLANVLVGCYHRTVIVMHHVLEKLLLTECKAL